MTNLTSRLFQVVQAVRTSIQTAMGYANRGTLRPEAFAHFEIGMAMFFSAQRRLSRLYARWLEGRHAIRPRASRAGLPAAPRKTPRMRLPPGFRFLGHSGILTNGRTALEIWITTDPELPRFLAEAPQAGRILRPICRLLLVEPPPLAVLPPRPRKPREPSTPRPPKPPRETRYWKPHTGTGPAMPDRHRLKIPGINAPRLKEDRRKTR